MRVSHLVRRKNDSDTLRHHRVNVEARGYRNYFCDRCRWATGYLSAPAIVVAPSPLQNMHFPPRNYSARNHEVSKQT